MITDGTTMDYRIEKQEGVEVIAKRARYGGEQEISQKNIKRIILLYMLSL